jgi:hypothetical protein
MLSSVGTVLDEPPCVNARRSSSTGLAPVGKTRQGFCLRIALEVGCSKCWHERRGFEHQTSFALDYLKKDGGKVAADAIKPVAALAWPN